MHASLLYAGLLGLLFVWLSARTIRARRLAKVPRGDGGDADLLKARGVHANTAEYVPLTLILMGFAEISGAPVLLIHAIGLTLVAGRLIYVYGASREPETFRFRVIGMGTTFTALVTACLTALAVSIPALF